jgi:hypothetical protein
LIEKPPLTEKHLKQQILLPNQSRPTSFEVLRSLICNPNVGITPASPKPD